MIKPIWAPSQARIQSTKLSEFIAYVAAHWDVDVSTYDELYRFSVTRLDAFWDAVWTFLGVIGDKGDTILVKEQPIKDTKWFPQARLNFAENLLKRRDDEIALIARNEQGARREVSWRQLYDAVSQTRQALLACGVQPGDRVAACLPNVPEAVIALLAATSIGAIWSCCSPDYGEQALLDRFGQIEPSVLFLGDGYRYAGKFFDLRAKAQQLIEKLPSLKRAVMVPCAATPDTGADQSGAVSWDAFIAPYAPETIAFPRFAFDHPLYILFSSGTTGEPKAIIHGAGGCLLQNLKRIALHADIAPGDRTFYHTTTGWVVWNNMVHSLAWNSSIVLYDGSPTYPKIDSLFDLLAEEKVNAVRIVPALIETYAKAGLHPAVSHDLSALKSLMAGSAPLLPHQYEYVYSKIKSEVFLFSPAGGTDSMTPLATGQPIGPVYAGEIQARALGMKVEVFDDAGKPIIDEPGELVVTAPFPSVPLGFWGDSTGERLFDAHFSKYPGIWHHGDWAKITPRGGVIIYGRSDATLNINGVRMGTSEIYRGLEKITEVKESVAVAHRANSGERIVLFVLLAAGAKLDEALTTRIRQSIRESATARHVPSVIVDVADIPRSMNGKPSEIAIRDMINGRAPNAAGLINPQSLELFRSIPELAS
jgi:acetoacetyl-CoA synthetase